MAGAVNHSGTTQLILQWHWKQHAPQLPGKGVKDWKISRRYNRFVKCVECMPAHTEKPAMVQESAKPSLPRQPQKLKCLVAAMVDHV